MVSLSTLPLDFFTEPTAAAATAIADSSQLFLTGFIADPLDKSVIFGMPDTSTFFLLPPSPESRRELGEREPRLPPPPGDAAPLLPPAGEGCLYLEGTIIAGSFAALRFSSLAATRLGTTHLDGAGDEDLDVPLTAGEDALEAPLTEGDGAREAAFDAGDGSRCLAGAGEENRRFTAEPPGGGAASGKLRGARTVLLTAASVGSEGREPREPDGMRGGAASEEESGLMT
jgi:hypothetical protein